MSRCRERVLVQVILVLAVAASASELAAQPKASVPDAHAQEAAQTAANELFGARFRSAKTAADESAVAREMIEAALKLQDGTADQYVLLKIAREIAAGAGDAAAALQAAEEQAERFDVPAAKLKAETLLAAAREARATPQQKAVAEAALQVVKDWADASEVELPLSVCEAGRSAAQKARQFELVKELAAKADELKKQRKAAQEYRQALAVMQDDPVEPAANLTAGRYLCFVAGDWERGVPYLALGSDAGLKAVALKELRGAASADEQAAIGDMWWALGETKRGLERDALLLRAGAWYRQAEPTLVGGLAGLKLKQRLAELAKLGREIPTLALGTPSSSPPPCAIAPFDAATAKRHQEAWAKYLGVPVETTNSIGMRFVLIPPGEFEMGSTEAEVATMLSDEAKAKNPDKWYTDRLSAEAPKHRVRIPKPFWLGVHEVTRGQFRRFVDDRGYQTEPERDGKGGHGPVDGQWKNDPRFVWTWDPGLEQADAHPVVYVTWNDVTAFCEWLSQKEGQTSHLPTETQWEYACRAGTTTTWYSGNDEGALREHAWLRFNAGYKTHPVAQKSPNAWGLYDMHGNVWEWCQDWFGERYYATSPMDDPPGPSGGSHRMIRGGGWGYGASGCRASFRDWSILGQRHIELGFRVARSIRSAESVPASPSKSGEEHRLGPPQSQAVPAPRPPTPRPAAIPRLARGKPTGPAPPLAVAPFDANKAKELQTAWAEYLKIPVVLTNSIGMKLVLVPPGEFEMISSSDQKGARVRITKPFYLGQCEVTQEQYQLVAGRNPSYFKGEPALPVESVSWTEAAVFCGKLSGLPDAQTTGAFYRLPTEAEWEYACRAGANFREQVGEYAPEALSEYVWWKGNAQGRTHGVGQLRPNSWGLFDMRGNVTEWVADWRSAEYYANPPPEDPTGPASGTDRVARGRDIRGERDDGWRWLWRDRCAPDRYGANFGFRVAISVSR